MTLVVFTTLALGQRGGMSRQQMDSKKAPKIGVVYGTVIDSASSAPIAYASISIINNRSNTIMTGGITNEDGEFQIKEIPLGKHKVVVEYIGYKKQELGPFTFLPFGDNQTEYNLETISLSLIRSMVTSKRLRVKGFCKKSKTPNSNPFTACLDFLEVKITLFCIPFCSMKLKILSSFSEGSIMIKSVLSC